MADKELVTALQKGGYVMYMRHPKTHPDQADTDPLNFDKPNIVDAAGKDFLDIGEGETAIFQPLGDGKFKPVARVTVARWSQLAK